MKLSVPHLNLVLAWIWIVFGFGSGLMMGLKFHREDWLGGYGSYKRRLYRLAHVSFFGLAMVNLLFYLTARSLSLHSHFGDAAAWSFVAGAITMPLCCLVMAQDAKWKMLFAVPVVSLLGGGLLTLWEVIKL